MSDKREITIHLRDWTEKIEAKIIGPFAIFKREGWVLSHIATGYLVTNKIPTRERAISLARALRKMNVWDFTDPMTTKGWSKYRMKLIHRAIKIAKATP